MPTPILSICIPTFNRAELLRQALGKAIRELTDLNDCVEVVVSDNASTDHTRLVVGELRGDAPIRYHRNERNVGIAANVHRVVEAATGDYCWILGDDDLLAHGAVVEILRLLAANPGVPAIVTGYAYVDETRRCADACDTPAAWRRIVFDPPDDAPELMRWEDTCVKSRVPGLHTSIVGCVFSRDLWRKVGTNSAALEHVEPLTTLESTFPHTSVWVRMLSGRTILFAPQVFACLFVGSQEWFKRCWPAIMFSFALQLALMMRANGARDHPVRHYEDTLLSQHSLAALINAPNDYAKAHFSLPWLIGHYGDRYALINNLARLIRQSGARGPIFLHRVVLAALQAHRGKGTQGFRARLRFIYAIGVGLLAGRKHRKEALRIR